MMALLRSSSSKRNRKVEDDDGVRENYGKQHCRKRKGGESCITYEKLGFFCHGIYLPLQELDTLFILYLLQMHRIWKEKNLLLFKQLVQGHFYCWALMARLSCLSMWIILDARFGDTDREMQLPCNQIYSVRHNCQSFPGLSHLAGYFSEMYFSRKMFIYPYW